MGDIVGYLAKGALEGRDLLAFLAGQAIGADDVLQHHHGGGAEDGEDSQRQQRFDQSETAHFRYHGGVTQVRRVASGAGSLFCRRTSTSSARSCGSAVSTPCQRTNQRVPAASTVVSQTS